MSFTMLTVAFLVPSPLRGMWTFVGNCFFYFGLFGLMAHAEGIVVGGLIDKADEIINGKS